MKYLLKTANLEPSGLQAKQKIASFLSQLIFLNRVGALDEVSQMSSEKQFEATAKMFLADGL